MENFINGLSASTLDGDITDSATSLDVVNAATFTTSPNFRIRVDDELMLVTAVTSNTFTIERAIEGTLPEAHLDGANVNFVLTAGALQQYREDSIQTGLLADVPTPDRDGVLYLPTDAPYLMRSNGTNWDHYGPFWKMNPPQVSDFSGVNLSGTTINNDNGFLYMKCPVMSVFNVRGYFKAAPTPPYRISALFYSDNPSVDEWDFGVGVRDSDSGKIMYWGGASLTGGYFRGVWRKMTNATTFNSNYFGSLGATFDPWQLTSKRIWWGLQDDGTNYNVQFSMDRYNWITYSSHAHTEFLTADQIGFVVGGQHASYQPSFSIMDFNVEF